MPHSTIALFPLSAHILPGGAMALRIFEQRYIRMIKEACAGHRPFGICMLNNNGDIDANQHIFPIGTLVEVTDFKTLPEGLLGVTVRGIDTFEIVTVETELDGLRVGQVTRCKPWQGRVSEQAAENLCLTLREIFATYPEFNSLYAAPQFDQADWVVWRWLELLPIPAKDKQTLLQSGNYETLLRFLNEWVNRP